MNVPVSEKTDSSGSDGQMVRFRGFAIYTLLLLLGYGFALVPLVQYAARTELHSHILLIPFVSAYLIFIARKELPTSLASSFAWGALPIFAGVVCLGLALGLRDDVSLNDYFSLIAFSLVSLFWGGGFLFLGARWMLAAAFPMVFLIFCVPLPDALTAGLERASMYASAEMADLLFNLAGTPHLRDGLVFQLPNIAIQVAQECSGIRSSWVLFITGILAAYLFLHRTWSRVFFVAFIIPLGVLRNGFRIVVIGLLCIEFGPQMIDSMIHRSGGPFFFVLSLLPLFLILWWMRRRESAG